MPLSIVVPCFNEEQVVEEFYRAVSEVVHASVEDYELVFVDDGSSDRTLDTLRALADDDAHVRYISFSRNFGKESAMLAGLRHCVGEAAIVMDVDLQHPPALIPRMLEQSRKGFDQVIARRTRDHDPWRRTVTARLYYRLMNRLVDVPLLDGAGDFRLLSRRAVDALLELPEYNRFSKGLFAWVGFDVAVIEYENVARVGGASKWTFSKLLNYGIHGILSFNDRPLRAAIYIGVGATVLSFAYVLVELIRTLAFGIDVPGYVTLVTAIAGLGGLQLLFLGIVGEYLGKVYYESKRRPHYIVREDNLISASGD